MKQVGASKPDVQILGRGAEREKKKIGLHCGGIDTVGLNLAQLPSLPPLLVCLWDV